MAAVPRDRYERPLILPPGEEKCVPYTRASKYAEFVTDSYSLSQWQQAMAVIGVIENDWLYNQIADHKEAYRNRQAKDGAWDKMNKMLATARHKAGANEKARYGNQLHALIEKVETGQEFEYPPEGDPLRKDLMAYEYETEELKPVRYVEQFVVVDEVQAAGSADQIRDRVVDSKSGKLDDAFKFSVQLALYSRGKRYACLHEPSYGVNKDGEQIITKDACEREPEAHLREAIEDVDQHKGLIIHIPQQSGTCKLYDLDLSLGWKAALELVPAVREFRRAKVLYAFGDMPPF